MLALLEFHKTHHSSFLNQVLIWLGFNVCFKLMHHNEKSWQDYLGRSFLDLAELHCFQNFNEDTQEHIFRVMPGSSPAGFPLKSPGLKFKTLLLENYNFQLTYYSFVTDSLCILYLLYQNWQILYVFCIYYIRIEHHSLKR